jgi:hypothetical protein
MPSEWRIDASTWNHPGAQFVWLADGDTLQVWHCGRCFRIFHRPHGATSLMEGTNERTIRDPGLD